MTLDTILLLAGLTYASRAAALVLLPAVPPVLTAVLDRMPGPLFAGLAVASLLGGDGGITDPVALAAVVGALVATPTRSLPVILVVGMAAACLATLVT